MMKIRCDRSEMVERLGVIAGIVPSNSPKAVLYDFLLQTREGSLLAEANDLEVAGRVRIDRVEVMEDGKLALPAARLLSILREIPDNASGVKLEASPEIWGVSLNADGYEFKLFGHDPDEFPGITEVELGRSFDVSRESFAQSLRRVAIAVARDAGRYQLGGVFFEVKNGKLTLTATDGKRLTNDFLKIDDPRESEIGAIVPSRAVDAILKMLASPSAGSTPPSGGAALSGGTASLGNSASSGSTGEKFTLGFTDTDVVVRTASSQLNAKLIEGTFPNYHSALVQNSRIKVKLRRSDLLSAARSAQLMSDAQTSTVIFRFEGEWLNIRSQAKDIGETRIQIKAEVENGPLEIRFNPSYFVDALRSIEDEEVRIEFESAERPGIFRGGAHYRHMIMPLVLEKR
jgi:DNA polymerase-3 subunit beta